MHQFIIRCAIDSAAAQTCQNASSLSCINASNLCDVHLMIVPGSIPSAVNALVQVIFFPNRRLGHHPAGQYHDAHGNVRHALNLAHMDP